MNKKTKYYVFLMIFAIVLTCIGCIETDNSGKAEKTTEDSVETAIGDPIETNTEDSVSSEKSNFGKFSYDEDVSLVGKVVEEDDSFGYIMYRLESEEDGMKIIDIPDDENRYYQIKVTTDDPESEIEVNYQDNYTYEYKKDKFSDFSSASGDSGLINMGKSDKMRDFNKSIEIMPMPQSSDALYIKYVAQPDALETKLTDRNFSIVLKIPENYIPTSAEKTYKDGDIITSNGHITIEEIERKEVNQENGATWDLIG